MFQFRTFFITFGALFVLVAATPLALSESQVGVNTTSTPPQDHHQYPKSSLKQVPPNTKIITSG
ncbi:hypothetical protein BDN72DRAFT_840990 [Pluteus cervinus]|uniref:Uncharacterized protein n=1 Tax=Pluteus cervinus TaxID=181527 RepID=A0ACD3ATR5_9AGAR|nr:hypothetical protein BDN72DRAFT_840990 [Pluteus cervinus]